MTLILNSFRKSWPIKGRQIKENSQEWFEGEVAEKKVSVISYLRNLKNQNFTLTKKYIK